jgi:hypothetical protein
MTVRPNGIPWGNYQKQNKTTTQKSPKTIKSKAKTKNQKLEKKVLLVRLRQSGQQLKKSPKTIKSKAKTKNQKLGEKNSLISEAASIWSA